MSTLFQHNGLQITEDYIRAESGTFLIRDVRRVWTSRHRFTRGNRVRTALLGVGLVLVLVGFAVIGRTDLPGWLAGHWAWLVAAPVLVAVAAFVGLLDPVAIYLEKRRHALWIATSSGKFLVWQHNRVEVNKALRTIKRARERRSEIGQVQG